MKVEISFPENEQEMIEDKEFFEKVNPGYTFTGKYIHIEFTDRYGLPYSETLAIMKGRFTPYGMARQVGNKIICARYDRYWKFDLNGNIINLDAEDDSTDR